jgi:NAD(P)-dependent dehydrogenase (short-subunit alcohol dehydrogenase family)
MRIAGKVALVTGAGSGIGRAIALRLAREGAAVVVDDISPRGGRAVVREIEAAGGRAVFVRADVGVDSDVRRMIAFATKTFGALDILVNNAGCTLPEPAYPDAPAKQWSRVLDVYLRGVMLATQLAIESMRQRGGGAVVKIASAAGIGYGPSVLCEYAAAKAGVVRLTATLGGLKERDNIRVNCICPGWVNTPMSQATIAAMPPAVRRRVVPPVLIEPEEIAADVVRLVRDDRLAGRVLLHYEGQRPRLVPAK